LNTHEELVLAREALLERTVSFFAAQQGVTGIFLSGSVPAGSADAYSDIDLRIIATPEVQARLVRGRLSWPTHWGDLLFNEWVDGTQHCVSHFRPFVKIDVFYWTPEMFQPSAWFKMPTKIFLDRDGLVQRTLAQSQSLAFSPPPCAEVSRVLSKALAGTHEVVRRARRGELFYAQSLLEQLRSNMATLDAWMLGFEPAGPHDLKLPERVSDALVTALHRSYVGLNADDIDQAVVDLSTVLVGQIVELHNKFDLKRTLATDLFAADLVRKRQVV
jgi:predicted nucleotidyltransferase